MHAKSDTTYLDEAKAELKRTQGTDVTNTYRLIEKQERDVAATISSLQNYANKL